MNFNELLSPEEQAAIAVLAAGGFKAFTEAKMADVRELGTGLRRRTFRNRGRYQLVLACRNLEGRQLLDTAGSFQATESDQAAVPLAIATADELREAYPELCRQLLEQGGQAAPVPPPKPLPAKLKPVSEMLKEELLAEARTYPEITGEHGMNKPELAAAVQAQRDRRALIHRSFKD